MTGQYVIAGEEPDGDSVRFIADTPEYLQCLHRAYRIKLSRNGSIQLRLEGMDATELHYGQAAQPFGAEARDRLLALLGFTHITYDARQPTRVTSSHPASVRGTILTRAADAHGRPIAYALLAADAGAHADGTEILVDQQLLDRTLNLRLVAEGLAYYTVYTSTPKPHRDRMRAVAQEARAAARGVWAKDTAADFVLDDQASIGPEGQVILPKLFRRCTDYLADVAKHGYRGNLKDWLVDVSVGSRNENDGVVLHDAIEVRLSDLVEQRNRHVVFKADPLDITFVEK